MNLNRKQFVRAVERGKSLLNELKQDYPELKLKAVFSRFGSRCGQCDMTTDLRKIVMGFPEMLVPRHDTLEFRKLLRALENDPADSVFQKEAEDVEKIFLHPDIQIYRGDVLIEFRPGVLRYKSLRGLQQDSRLPQDFNEIGNIRVIAGSLELLADECL